MCVCDKWLLSDNELILTKSDFPLLEATLEYLQTEILSFREYLSDC